VVLTACLPLELGGPTPAFGNDPAPDACPQHQATNQVPCGPQPLFWAAIGGPWGYVSNGDPYASRCVTGTANGCTPNPLYRSTGYDYVVDVASSDVGRPLTVQGYDLGVYYRTTGNATSDCRPGAAPWPWTTGGLPDDFTPQHCQTGDSGTGMHMDLQLFAEDGNPSTASATTPVPGCHLTVTAETFAAAPPTYKNAWADICTFTPPVAGEYLLRVRNSGLDDLADEGDGFNAYSLAVRGASASSIRPLNDASVLVNAHGETARTYLARIPPNWAGRVVHVDLFDIGDAATFMSLQVRGPPTGGGAQPGTGAAVPSAGLATGCTFNSTPSPTKGPATPNVAQYCRVFSDGRYGSDWLRISIAIDPAYSCAADCWRTLAFTMSGQTSGADRFIWSVSST
jgi:hypothetical protein